jgi:hypothetical protein
MAEPYDKTELIAGLDRARARLARNLDGLRHDLDVATHIKESFHRNKAAYIGGASMFGLLLAKLPSRKKKVYVDRKSGKEGIKDVEKAGIWLLLLDFLFKTLRPALTSIVAKQVTEYVRSRARGND